MKKAYLEIEVADNYDLDTNKYACEGCPFNIHRNCGLDNFDTDFSCPVVITQTTN